MNARERRYLNISLQKLEKILPESAEEMMRKYEVDETAWSIEEIDNLVFCLFGFLVRKEMEQLILLVYDREDRIIADAGAFHTDVKSFLEQTEIFDFLSDESDWMYLEHYVLSNRMFPSLPYPYCEQNRKTDQTGEVLLYTNAYVSSAFRRKGIFRTMEEYMKVHALRYTSGMIMLYSIFSMDPDVACYGPDARDEPYYYSFERDEPLRLQNKAVAEKIGYTPIRLEMDEPEKETDGTGLWFAVRREVCEIIEKPTA